MELRRNTPILLRVLLLASLIELALLFKFAFMPALTNSIGNGNISWPAVYLSTGLTTLPKQVHWREGAPKSTSVEDVKRHAASTEQLQGVTVITAPRTAAKNGGGTSAANFAKLVKKQKKLQDDVLVGKAPLSRAIIVRCLPQDCCAGLGDRVYGILVLFLSAILTDRAFFIESNKPKPLTMYVVPGTVDWRISSIQNATVREKVTRCLHGKKNEYDECRFHSLRMPHHTCADVVRQVFSSRSVVVILSNHRTDCIQHFLAKQGLVPVKGENGFNGTTLDHQMWAANVSHIMFHALFKFKENVLIKANKVLTLPGTTWLVPPECLVCLHVRTGGRHDRPRHTNLADFATCSRTVQADLEQAKGCPRQPTWLIVADNAFAAAKVAKYIDLLTVNTVISTANLGAPIHIDFDDDASGDMMVHVFVDWYLLTRCKYFVASLSTFSGTASIAGGAGVHRYDMETSGHIGGCKLRSIAYWQRDSNI